MLRVLLALLMAATVMAVDTQKKSYYKYTGSLGTENVAVAQPHRQLKARYSSSGSRSSYTRTTTARYSSYYRSGVYVYGYAYAGAVYYSYGYVGTGGVVGSVIGSLCYCCCIVAIIVLMRRAGDSVHEDEVVIVEEEIVEHHDDGPSKGVAYPSGVQPGQAPPSAPPGYGATPAYPQQPMYGQPVGNMYGGQPGMPAAPPGAGYGMQQQMMAPGGMR